MFSRLEGKEKSQGTYIIVLEIISIEIIVARNFKKLKIECFEQLLSLEAEIVIKFGTQQSHVTIITSQNIVSILISTKQMLKMTKLC